jgi:nucleotide-binding universal stress UspA family protein
VTKAELKAAEAEVTRRLAEAEELCDVARRLYADAMFLKASWHDRIQQLERAGRIHDVVGPLTRVSIN